MIKTGIVEEGTTRCDKCGAVCACCEGKTARCEQHKQKDEKVASGEVDLKSFTEPLPEER